MLASPVVKRERVEDVTRKHQLKSYKIYARVGVKEQQIDVRFQLQDGIPCYEITVKCRSYN